MFLHDHESLEEFVRALASTAYWRSEDSGDVIDVYWQREAEEWVTKNVWRINWRNPETGNIVETAGVDYDSWQEADAALSTLLGFRRTLTATIDRSIVEVQ